MKRREILKAALVPAAAAQQVKTPWPDPVANEVVPSRTAGITHGPELGHPSSTSMRIWLRTAKPSPFRVVYDERTPLSETSAGVEGHTDPNRDSTGYVDLTGLKPNTRYFYGIVINGQLVDTRIDYNGEFPSFQTLPDATSCPDAKYNPGGRFNLRFSVGCCADQSPEPDRGGQYSNAPAFATMFNRHGRDLAFHLMNGDFVYEELRDGTQDGIRNNFKLYWERGRNMSNLFRHVPVLFTYDDHEISSEDGPGEVGLKKGPWLGRDTGLVPWYEYAGWANFPGLHFAPMRFGKARVQAGGDILFDSTADFSSLDAGKTSTILVSAENRNAGVYRFANVADRNRLRVEPAFTADEVFSYSIGTHHYYDWKVGNCHFFALDARGESNRYSPARALDPKRTILGESQLKWLMDGVRNTDAEFVFIVSPVSWVIYHTNFHVRKTPPKPGERSPKEDGFTGAVVEREKLLSLFESLQKQVIIFTGDLHNSYAIEIAPNVWEFMVGPLNSAAHPLSTAGYPPKGGWFDSEGRKVKIKWLASWPDDVNYRRLHPTIYGVCQVNNVYKSGKQASHGLHWIAYDSPQVVMQFYDGYTGELLYSEGISLLDSQSG